MTRYPRDMTGHGSTPPHANWPGGAKIAVQIVLNYEEGGENCVLHGDPASEAFLSEITGAQAWSGQRHWNMESIYEYGARAGFWRVHRLLKDIPVTVYGVATALARAPGQVRAMQEAGWEIASHGLKWIEHKDMSAEEERAQIRQAIQLHTEVAGGPPRGWYTGRCSMNTVDLAAAEGDFAYIADSYADDLPYWVRAGGKDQLIVPYTMDCNDMRFAIQAGFTAGDQFETMLRDAFDTLYAEGEAGAPKVLSIGLHCRLIGRPSRIAALRRALEYFQSHRDVWFATRLQIAEHWAAEHPPVARVRPSEMDRDAFLAAFGGVFEHSPWIAEAAHKLELGPTHDTAIGVHAALSRIFRSASDEKRLGVLTAHPDLAGKLAEGERLTAESTAEQASVGRDALTDEERARFAALNEAYTSKFGFPFIIAVGDNTKASILEAFARRLENDRDTEFAEACRQVERIAELRLQEKIRVMNRIIAQPLTANAFAPFGDVLEATGAPDMIINQGRCGRFHDRARLDFGPEGRAGISVFQSEPAVWPVEVALVERHPDGSQAFVSMTGRSFLVVVAPDEGGAPGAPVAFIAAQGQGVNFHRGTWHGVLTPLHEPGLFAVVDRIGATPNLEEHRFDAPYLIEPGEAGVREELAQASK